MDRRGSLISPLGRPKTSAEIISEAKASFDTGYENLPIQPLKTKRPFTPRSKNRALKDKTFFSIDGVEGPIEDRPRFPIRLEPIRPGSSKQDNSSSASLDSRRRQFRFMKQVEESEEREVESLAKLLCLLKKDDNSLKKIASLLLNLRLKLKESEKSVTKSLDSDEVLNAVEGIEDPEILLMAVDAALLMDYRHSITKICKYVFTVSKNDKNDSMFLSKNILPTFLPALGFACPQTEPEALIFGYGSLKFISMNSAILLRLESLGLIELLVLHIKILSKTLEEFYSINLQHIAFQMTACLRNTLNTKKGREMFVQINGMDQLVPIFHNFSDDVDIVCNIARILSIMSADEDLSHGFLYNEELLSETMNAIILHSKKPEVVVRLAYCLGNLLGSFERVRTLVISKPNFINKLAELLAEYAMNSKTEDVAIKIVRIFANISINQEAGMEVALTSSVILQIIYLLEMYPDSEEIVVSCVSTLNNLSFYPIIHSNRVYKSIISVLSSNSQPGTLEALRVLGNLSRSEEIRNDFCENGGFQKLLKELPSENKDFNYSAVGVVVNLLVDEKRKSIFKEAEGFNKLVDVCQYSFNNREWTICTLVFQALWNYSINLKVPIAESTTFEMLLSSIIDKESLEDSAEYSELYSVAMGLLIRFKKSDVMEKIHSDLNLEDL